MRSANHDFIKVAEADPYWGMVADDQSHSRSMSQAQLNEFYQSGHQYTTDLFADIDKFRPGFLPSRVLDFGCGVGRLLLPLAGHSHEAVGVDIIPRLLELAANRAGDEGITNAVMVHGDDALTKVQGPFNLVHSFIGIQHIQPRRGLALLRHFMNLLVPGGMFVFQVNSTKRHELINSGVPEIECFQRSEGGSPDLKRKSTLSTEAVSEYDFDLNDILALVRDYTRSAMSIWLIPDEGPQSGIDSVTRRLMCRQRAWPDDTPICGSWARLIGIKEIP